MKKNYIYRISCALTVLLISSLSFTIMAEDECFPGEMFEYNKMLFYIEPEADFCELIDFFYIDQEGALSTYNSQWGNYTDKADRLKWLEVIDYSGDIVIPSVVEYNGTYYPVKSICCWTTGAFGTAKTTTITVPGSVYRLAGLSGVSHHIEKLTLKQGVNYITGVERLYLKELDLPSTITFIAHQSFREVEGLQEFLFPPLVTQAESEVLYKCPDLKVLNMNNVRMVSEKVGCNLPKLTILDLGNITELKGNAFNGLSSLEELTIPEMTQKIGSNCFSYIPNLKVLTLPSHPIEVENSFNNLGVKKIYSRCNYPYDLNGSFSGCDKKNITVYVPKGAKEAYQAHPDWGEFGEIIEDAAGVDELVIEKFEAKGGTGFIEVVVSEPAEVSIYTLDGRNVATRRIDSTEKIEVNSGAYIVRCGTKTTKVIVK